jgi:hypothetical protein
VAPAILATTSAAFDFSGDDDQIEIWQAFQFDFTDTDLETATIPLMTMVPLRSESQRPMRFSRVDHFADNHSLPASFSFYTPKKSIERELGHSAVPAFADGGRNYPTYPPAPLVGDSSIDSTAPPRWMSEPVVNIILGMALISLSGLLKKKSFRARPRLTFRVYDSLSN